MDIHTFHNNNNNNRMLHGRHIGDHFPELRVVPTAVRITIVDERIHLHLQGTRFIPLRQYTKTNLLQWIQSIHPKLPFLKIVTPVPYSTAITIQWMLIFPLTDQ